MAEISEKRKRKREPTVEARITYHTPTKIFERVFKGTRDFLRARFSLLTATRVESSLEDIKGLVRQKLGLAGSVRIDLAQVRAGSTIVLEDGAAFSPYTDCFLTYLFRRRFQGV